jgi:putative membrane protein
MAKLMPIRSSELEAEPSSEPLALAQRDPRIDWSAEQTLLAWIRTGVAIMAFGFVIARSVAFFHFASVAADRFVTFAGVGMMLTGCLVSGAASWRHLENCLRIRRGEEIQVGPGAPILVAISTAALGLFLALAILI